MDTEFEELISHRGFQIQLLLALIVLTIAVVLLMRVLDIYGVI